MKSKLLLLYSWFVRTLLLFFPDIPIIMRFRGFLYSLGMNKSGINFQVSASATILGLDRIFIGDHVYIAHNVFIGARDAINIGDGVLIGINSVVVSGNHTMIDGSYRFGKSSLRPISISDGVWVASNVTVTAGTVIEHGAFIGPCSCAYGHYDANTKNFGCKAGKKN